MDSSLKELQKALGELQKKPESQQQRSDAAAASSQQQVVSMQAGAPVNDAEFMTDLSRSTYQPVQHHPLAQLNQQQQQQHLSTQLNPQVQHLVS